jgi:DNA-binding response OmpR family regulator
MTTVHMSAEDAETMQIVPLVRRVAIECESEGLRPAPQEIRQALLTSRHHFDVSALAAESVVPDVELSILVAASADADDSWLVRRVAELRRAGYANAIMTVAPEGGDQLARIALYAGADDSLVGLDREDLLARTFALTRRVLAKYCPEPASLQLTIDPNTRLVSVGGVTARLGPTAFRIFVYLAGHRGRWLKTPQILSGALNTHHLARSSLVRVSVHRIRAALGTMGWIIQGDERGYRLAFERSIDGR